MKYYMTFFLLFISFCPTICAAQADAQRIQQGVNLIKLACGTGVSKESTTISANGQGSITLTKKPGIEAGGEITYSKEEAQGLLIALNKEMSGSDALAFGVEQMRCMKPYVDRIFDVVFPKPPETVSLKEKCSAKKSSCTSEVSAVFEQCIARSMRSCMPDCQRRGYSFDDCTVRMCAYSQISDAARAIYDEKCHEKSDYIEKKESCDREYSECMNGN